MEASTDDHETRLFSHRAADRRLGSTADTVTWSMAWDTESVFCSMPMSDDYQVVNAKDYLRSK